LTPACLYRRGPRPVERPPAVAEAPAPSETFQSKGKDILKGDAGADTIDARDGEADTINCGLGRDTLLRDSIDSVSRCE
jgi:hypothetical protein